MTILGGSHYRVPTMARTAIRRCSLIQTAVSRQDKLHLTPQELAMGTTPATTPSSSRIGGRGGSADLRRHRVPRGHPAPGPRGRRARALPVAHVESAWGATESVTAPTPERWRTSSTSSSLRSSAPPAARGRGDPRHRDSARGHRPIDRMFGFHDGVVVDHDGHRTEGIVVADLDLDLIAASVRTPNHRGSPTSVRTCTRDLAAPRRSGR